MKFRFLLSSAFLLALASCSSDSNNTNSGNTTNYLPLEDGNFWTYRVEGDAVSERDSLYVSNDTVINSKTYKKFKTLFQPFGFYSNSLHDNGVRKEGASLLLSGSAGLNLGDVFPVDFTLDDFVIFKESAIDNEQLSSISDIIDQDFQGYPLKLEYTMKSVSVETLPVFTSPDGEVYADVKKVKTTLNLKISTTVTIPNIPFPVPITIMNPQDVVSSFQYYSKDIGMIYATTTISYQLQDLSSYGVTLPIPTSGSQTQEEFLDTYQVD
ncbi:hypothetical protein [Flavobacterium sp. GT3R68]|uniref:hypothetical protein n=1 Tax=Flavobacterium sp. GT3R68 TaxID=2594437 RepID=UPI000F881D0D|nr:hypothetical protein [Flavobacterium sp. GT3R68]RTY93623.1 hypothetical protein EKL32_14955 [Flavobacterium sp. GSN2]TRW91656.1 hypothetical protein FNW07_07130 [Flavobacterium sp. GT3R68]